MKSHTCFYSFIKIFVVVAIFWSQQLFASSGSDQDVQLAQLLELNKEAELFSQLNISYLKTVRQCLQDGNPQSEICDTHIDHILRIRDESFPLYRRYRALNTLNFFYFRSVHGPEAFSRASIQLLINTQIEHLSFKIPLLFSKVQLKPLAPLSAKEVENIYNILTRKIGIFCDEFIQSRDAKNVWTKYSYDVPGLFCKNLARADFGVPALQSSLLDNAELRMLYQLREQFRRKLIDIDLPSFAEQQASVFINEVQKFPALIFIRSQDSFSGDLKEAFDVMLTNALQATKTYQSVPTDIQELSPEKKQAWIEKLTPLYAFSFLVRAKLLGLKQENESQFSILERSFKSWESSESHKQMAILGVMIAANVGCFLVPQVRVVGMIALKSLCFFGMNQPLAIFLAVNTSEQLNSAYSLFLLGASGEGRMIDYEVLRSKVGDHMLSLLLVPLGTPQSLNLMGKVRQALN